MKKFFFILFVILILVGIFFAFKSCEPRVKPTENTTSEDASNETATTIETTEDLEVYRTPFIDANTEFTCQITLDTSILEDDALFKTTLDASYQKYGFPINDNEKMIKILDKYENDQDVINAIKENVKECQK